MEAFDHRYANLSKRISFEPKQACRHNLDEPGRSDTALTGSYVTGMGLNCPSCIGENMLRLQAYFLHRNRNTDGFMP
jgi:hypothetical protein